MTAAALLARLPGGFVSPLRQIGGSLPLPTCVGGPGAAIS